VRVWFFKIDSLAALSVTRAPLSRRFAPSRKRLASP
jgi:hypothetical protein